MYSGSQRRRLGINIWWYLLNGSMYVTSVQLTNHSTQDPKTGFGSVKSYALRSHHICWIVSRNIVTKAWRGTRLEDGPVFPVQWPIHRNLSGKYVVAEQWSDHTANSKAWSDSRVGNLIARSLNEFDSQRSVLRKVARKVTICDRFGDILIQAMNAESVCIDKQPMSSREHTNLIEPHAATAWIQHIVWTDA